MVKGATVRRSRARLNRCPNRQARPATDDPTDPIAWVLLLKDAQDAWNWAGVAMKTQRVGELAAQRVDCQRSATA
jgi:hypothetical protein